MKGTRLILWFLAFATPVAGCKKMSTQGGASRADTQAGVRGNTAFALDLYRQLRSSEGNLFFSPYSISATLALVYAGARGNTEKEMARALHFSLPQERLHPAFGDLQARLNAVQRAGHVTLSVANSLWPRRDARFLDDYLLLAQEHYDVSITPIDYGSPQQAADTVNRWVAEKTRQRIMNVVAPQMFSDLTRLVLVNAIYFKGTWVWQFDPRHTNDTPFYATPETSVPRPMMAGTVKVPYAEADGLQVLQLPYQGNDISMLIFLPRAKDGLGQLEDALSADALSSWKEGLRKREVLVFLPKFTMTRGLDLKESLRAMGMVDAFDLGQADFSGMSDAALCVDWVVHRAFVEVNEEGTEAAAATGMSSTAGRVNDPLRVRPSSVRIIRSCS
jgi:serpin B